MSSLGLFDLMQQFGTLVAVPYTIPLVLCFLVRKTPPWSGWTTVLVCFVASFLTTRYLDAAWLERVGQLSSPLSASDRNYWTVAVGLFLNVIVGTTWFLGSRAWWQRTPESDRARIEEFNTCIRTPIDFGREEAAGSDSMQARVLGLLSHRTRVIRYPTANYFATSVQDQGIPAF